MSDRSTDDVRREVQARRAAFETSLTALADRVEHGAERVGGAVARVQHVARDGRAWVERHPMLFVAVSVGVGFALGSRGRRRALPAPAPMVAAAPRPSFLWSAAAFVGRMALRGVLANFTGAAEAPPPGRDRGEDR